jgi:hypothetical protein
MNETPCNFHCDGFTISLHGDTETAADELDSWAKVLHQANETRELGFFPSFTELQVMAPFYQAIRQDGLFRQLRTLRLGSTFGGLDNKHPVTLLNLLGSRGTLPLLEHLDLRIMELQTLYEQVDDTDPTLSLESGAWPNLRELLLPGCNPPDERGDIDTIRQLLRASGERLQELAFWEMSGSSNMWFLIAVMELLATEWPSRTSLRKLRLPEPDSDSAHEAEILKKSKAMFSRLPGLEVLGIGKHWISLFAGLLEAKEAGGLPRLRLIEEASFYITRREDMDVLHFLMAWLKRRYEAGEEGFTVKYHFSDRYLHDPRGTLARKLNRAMPWLEVAEDEDDDDFYM